VLFCGCTDWDGVGRRPSESFLVAPRCLSFPKRIRAVFSGPTACHCVCIDVDGGAYSWGRNESGALGHGDTATRAAPTLLPDMLGSRVKQASCGRSHTALLTNEGVVFTMGAGKCGQLGHGRLVDSSLEPKQVVLDSKAFKQVSCGADFTCIIDETGRLFSCGLPENGQLGLGTTGEFIERAGKVSFDFVVTPTVVNLFLIKDVKSKLLDEVRSVRLEDIACGRNHTVAVEMAPLRRVWTWGFGGYGRLGHACQDAELRPRLVDTLARLSHVEISSVSAGANCSLALSSTGHLFYWGKLPNSPRGEATM
ncbi:unnamed protein product, partial [Choristocarpus tenellus]